MTLMSDIVSCSHCDKSIEYCNSRISRSTGYLVCWDCKKTPSVPEPPTDAIHYREIFAEFKSAKLFDSPHISDYLHSPSEETLYERNLQEFDQLNNPISQIDRTLQSVGLRLPIRSSSRKDRDLFTPTPTSSSSPLSAQHQPPSPIGSVPLDQALTEFNLSEYNTSGGINLLQDALTSNQDEYAIHINEQRPTLAASPRRALGQRTNFSFVKPESSERKGKSFLCMVCHQHFKSSSALKQHKIIHRQTTVTPSTWINPGTSTSDHIPAALPQCHEHIDQAMSTKKQPSIKTKIVPSTKTPRSREVFIYRGGRSIRAPKNHPGNRFPCHYDWCKATFSTIDQLWEHIDNTTHDVRLMKVKYVCKNCNQTYAHRCSLVYHQHIRTVINLHHCQVCGKQFTKPVELARHRRTHTGERPFICDVCGKGFALKGDLTRHLRIHTGESPYQCDSCDRSFACNGHLKLHRRTHSGERPFTCESCGKGFNQSCNLIRHRLIHTGEKSFRCATCDKSYARKHDLIKHLRSH